MVEFPFDASSNFGDGGGRLDFLRILNLEVLELFDLSIEPFDLSIGMGMLNSDRGGVHISARGSAGGWPAVELKKAASESRSLALDWWASVYVECRSADFGTEDDIGEPDGESLPNDDLITGECKMDCLGD